MVQSMAFSAYSMDLRDLPLFCAVPQDAEMHNIAKC